MTWAANANINGQDNWENQVAWSAGLNLDGVSGWWLVAADGASDQSHNVRLDFQ
jgi:hypothetical protein